MTAGHIVKDQGSETAVAIGRTGIVSSWDLEDEGEKKAISTDSGPPRKRRMLDTIPQLCWDGKGVGRLEVEHRQPGKVETRRTDSMTRVFNDSSQRIHVTGSRDADKASFTGRVHRDSAVRASQTASF